MKKFFAVTLAVSLSSFSACHKQQSDAERQAQVEREVQRRLDAEHVAQEKQQLAQQEAELAAREKAVADKETATTKTTRTSSTPARSERRTASNDQPTASYDTFYTKLEPHGTWMETSDYGYVWQPHDA